MISPMEVLAVRPERWNVPFGDTTSDVVVDELLKLEPFCSMDPQRFPAALPLRGILKNDTRINAYQDGDIVVREGDYGHSAFLIIEGGVHVVLEGLDAHALGRQQPQKLGVWQSLKRLWNNPQLPEVRHQLEPFPEGLAAERPATDDPAQTRIFLQDIPRVLEGTKRVELGVGEIFGELAALTRTPRSATVIAAGELVLLEIRWQGLRDLMRRTDDLRKHIEQLYRENSLRVHLRETPLLSQLPEKQLTAVAEATLFETHGNFEWQAAFDAPAKSQSQEAIASEPLIAEEGQSGEGIILVRGGFARLSYRYGDGHRTSAYLGKGQIFGLKESIDQFQSQQPTPLASSLRALGYVDVLRIPQVVLEQHVYPLLSKSLLREAAEKHGVQCSQQHCDLHQGLAGAAQPQVETNLLEFLVEHRFINGSQAMVIDLDRCTRCDDCVRACAATHDNNPRFLRHGHSHGSFMVAHACMHCVDPVCMIGCPTGAIARDQKTGVVRINDLTCIGCSTCANSCPYDNIMMSEIRDSSGAIVFDEITQQPIHKATKCDLCAEHPSGPACQRACPHDALVRVDLGSLGEVSQLVNR